MHKFTLITSLFFLIMGIFISACAPSSYPPGSPSTSTKNSPIPSKATSQLLLQIDLRKAQIASPTPERLAQMQSQGLNTDNLSIQRIYIYLKQQLTQTQIKDLQALGITVYLDSWVPPAGNNPDGFYLADLPIDKLDALAAKDYVVRLDTAEKLLTPQSG